MMNTSESSASFSLNFDLYEDIIDEHEDPPITPTQGKEEVPEQSKYTKQKQKEKEHKLRQEEQMAVNLFNNGDEDSVTEQNKLTTKPPVTLKLSEDFMGYIVKKTSQNTPITS